MTRILFCQNDSPMRRSFWQKDSLITHTLFKLKLIIIFSQLPRVSMLMKMKFLYLCDLLGFLAFLIERSKQDENGGSCMAASRSTYFVFGRAARCVNFESLYDLSCCVSPYNLDYQTSFEIRIKHFSFTFVSFAES